MSLIARNDGSYESLAHSEWMRVGVSRSHSVGQLEENPYLLPSINVLWDDFAFDLGQFGLGLFKHNPRQAELKSWGE